MTWPKLRRRRTAFAFPAPGECGRGRHTLRTERMLLYTPITRLDAAAVVVTASDPEAQRWLGFPADRVPATSSQREFVARIRLGDPDSVRNVPLSMAAAFEEPVGDAALLVAVRLDDGRYAGSLQLSPQAGEIGGWLTLHSRGTGLGTELFRAAAALAHAHYGLATVRAGAEPENKACRGALTSAGFTPAEGPPRHTLEDGREIHATWYEHHTATPTRCPAAPISPETPAPLPRPVPPAP